MRFRQKLPTASGGYFSRTTSGIITDLQALRDLGVNAIDIDFERSNPEESVAEMRRFKDQVVSRL
jgi:3-dehydroquinate dehydratase